MGSDGKKPKLIITVPCYNEEKVLPVTAPMFLEKLTSLIRKEKISDESSVLFVNDGSSDGTWDIIKNLASGDRHYTGISLSRNRGHQNALLAGLMEAKDRCDLTISADADGQDDIDAMDQMTEEYLNGCDIVYGVRKSRKTDSFFKRFTAESYYRLLNRLGAETVYNHADYRLASSRVLKELASFGEVNLFLRGLFPLLGFKSSRVFYDRRERIAGESRYPLSKMLALAFNGITSLSVKPIRLITSAGVILALPAAIYAVWLLILSLRGGGVSGWQAAIAAVCLIGGIQLISLGVVGEYIGKIYLETKHRPRFIISEKTYSPDDEGPESGNF